MPRWNPIRVVAIAAVTLVASCAIATASAAPRPTDSSAKKGAEKQLPCLSYLSTATVSALSGVPSEPNPAGHMVPYPKSFGVPDGGDDREKIPGSVCQWVESPAGGEEASTGQLLVGYGSTAKGWRQLVAYFKAGAPDTGYPIGFADDPKYSPLNLGHGSKAFLVTADLASYYDSVEYRGPADLYMVCALTRRGNLLQVWFLGADVKQTTDWVVEAILTKDAKFF